ncbi:hypothetical protein CC1G_11028 [Coprinopsis cinerea okayama7|uniref:Uncharacterized protein n=1 Tax=Coprinopsis cinerea (strain Okayama-7 / 130 / ATCC MYA-4618 / FGSC 9003) TaxID=240176 RepID=A8NIS0_COPC7|nr:hypothetical protein CC1G_11028 [Coprinopsis cinerea okayama7\|eukprot:XP_001834058.1 hypothetical protein CC1G_11028 [Coprinopsis cinerea okayama7\
MSTSSGPTNTDRPEEEQQQRSQPLLLEDASRSRSDTTNAHSLDVSNQSTVRLDALGPMVVNRDGTLSRIANWDKMTEDEKERTLRVLSARNKVRLAKHAAAAENATNEGEVVSALKGEEGPASTTNATSSPPSTTQ